MVMVVIHHYFSCVTHHENIFATIFNDAIEIPLFFFVSGFFASKLVHQSARITLRAKFMQLIVPAVLMLSLNVWIHQAPLLGVIYNPYKQGYWFTFVLFSFIVIYLCSNYLGRKLMLNATWTNLVNLIIGITVSYIAYLSLSWALVYRTLNLVSAPQYFGYFYFVLGSILFSKRGKIINALSSTNSPMYVSIGGGDFAVYNYASNCLTVWSQMVRMFRRLLCFNTSNISTAYNLDVISKIPITKHAR